METDIQFLSSGGIEQAIRTAEGCCLDRLEPERVVRIIAALTEEDFPILWPDGEEVFVGAQGLTTLEPEFALQTVELDTDLFPRRG